MRRRVIPPLALGIGVVALWWILTARGAINSFFLPQPDSVLLRLIDGLRSGYLTDALSVTLLEALAGCLVATLVGVPLGYFIAKSSFFGRLVNPYLAASQAIPAVAIAPLLTIWIGYGMPSIIVLCTILVVFPIIVSTTVGIGHIDQDVVGAARLDGASGLRLARSIEIPLAAPAILGGLRTGFTLSFTGAVVGEMVMGGEGLGLLLTSAQHSSDTTGMFAVIALLALCATVIYALIGYAEKRADHRIFTTKEKR